MERPKPLPEKKPATRKERLAAALRENLKRRKTPAGGKPENAGHRRMDTAAGPNAAKKSR